MKREDSLRYKTFTRRAAVLGGLQVAAFGMIAGRLYYLQVVEADKFQALAENNRIDYRLLPPQRGRVLDRFGMELASNQRNYRVLLIPEQAHSVEATLDSLSEIVELDEHDRKRILRDVKRKRSFVPINLVENLRWEEFAGVNVHSPAIPGIHPEVGETRSYPHGEVFSHVVGYVGPVNDKDLANSDDPLLELPGFRLGKAGVERIQDEALRGSAGNQKIEVNAVGRVIREIERDEGQAGADINLTLDGQLQRFTHDRIKDEAASVVVMDALNGEILTMASTPGFNPNLFNIGMSTKQWRDLLENEKKPLTHKAISGQYPPGSTFKMIVALAAMKAGVVGPETRYYCTGKWPLGNHVFHCWKRHGHGLMDLQQSLQHSCDTYFYEIARKTGIDNIAKMARSFGLGVGHDIGLNSERKGVIPDRDWKRGKFDESWLPGETVNAGIGQGYITSTPLQLAVMTARLANGREAVEPLLYRQVGDVKPGADRVFAPLDIPERHLAVVREGMDLVSNHPRGTAYNSSLREGPWRLAGKTGTAQVRRISKAERQTGVLKNEELPWKFRDHALFVAYAPVKNPRYAISVIVEHGGSGSKAAAPIARDVMQEVLRRDPVAALKGVDPDETASLTEKG